MSSDEKVVISIGAQGMSDDSIEQTKERLIRDFNESGFRLASPVLKPSKSGEKGDVITVGQIGLALISAGLVQQAARIAVEFIKRNSKFTLQIGDIKISKDHASTIDIKVISEQLQKLLDRSKTRKSKR